MTTEAESYVLRKTVFELLAKCKFPPQVDTEIRRILADETPIAMKLSLDIVKLQAERDQSRALVRRLVEECGIDDAHLKAHYGAYVTGVS